MTRLSVKVRECMGWCPNTMPHPPSNDRGLYPEDPAAGRGGRPGLHEAYQKPDRFTALSVIFLFATLFVGGSIWWPALVLGIVVAGIMVLQVKSRSHAGD